MPGPPLPSLVSRFGVPVSRQQVCSVRGGATTVPNQLPSPAREAIWTCLPTLGSVLAECPCQQREVRSTFVNGHRCTGAWMAC